MKKVLSALLALAMLMTLLPVGVSALEINVSGEPVEPAAKSGKTGDCTWTLDNGHLTISGKGKIGDYSWGNYAPWGSTITSLTIEDGVTAIGDYAFYECDRLSAVTIPDSVTAIGEAAFYWCIRLTSISIPDSVTSLGDEAFYSCDRLTTVSFGKGLAAIGDKVFYDCDRLIAANIPDNIITVGDFAFYHCDKLAQVSTGDGLTTIDEYAFAECKSLNSLKLGDSVKTVGFGAFQSCLGMTSVEIPDNVKKVEPYAFYGCTTLSSVSIGKNTNTIGVRAFVGGLLTDFEIHKDNASYCVVDGVLYDKEKTTVVQYPGGRGGEYVIPDGITVIGASAFEYATELTSVTIPDSVTTIGDAAFAECEKLAAATIPNSVRTVGASAYYRCSALTEMHIPDSVDSIGEYAFYKCVGLTAVTIPYSITCLEGGVFAACEALTAIAIPDSVTEIGFDAFQGCNGLTTVVIPKGVTAIGDYAFGDCAGLTTVVLPVKVATIGDRAFFRCYALTDVWYTGTEAKREKMAVGLQNGSLTNATWHYSVTAEITAADCKTAGKAVYTCADGTDPLTVEYPANGKHTYDNGCDLSCNVCDYVGKVKRHVYDNACDTGCNHCGDTRKVAGHKYDNACDTKCNHCNTTRKVGDHKWKNGKCANCGKASPSKVKLTAQSATARYAVMGGTVSAKVTAKGSGLKYTWYVKNDGAKKYTKSSVTKATYSATLTTKTEGRRVYCVVTDKYGNKVQSKTFILREKVSVTTQPKTVSVKKNATAKVTVKAKGDGLKYTWYVKNAGAKKYSKSSITKSTYSIKMTAKTKNRLLYCVVTDKYGNKVQTKTVKLKMK